MKKLLTLLFIFITTIGAHALSIMPNSFDGSALCGNLSTTFLVPGNLQGKYTYDLTVTKNEAESYIFFDYNLEYGAEDTLKKITTDINEYFAGESYLNQEKINWQAVYTVSLGGTEIYRDTLAASPYTQCFETEYKCNKVKVTRKTLRKICPDYEYIPEFSAIARHDSILVSFDESTKLLEGSCDAIGYFVKEDSLILENLSPEFYHVYQVVGSQVYCITTPCPDAFYFPIGTADLHNCPPKKPDNVFEGSRLCNNLSLTLYLPKAIQDRYNYQYNAWIDEESGNLFVKYYLYLNGDAEILSEIKIDLSEVFTDLDLPQNQSIEVIQEVEYEGAPIYRKSSLGYAYQNCFEYSPTCEEVEIYRKSLREICDVYEITTSKSYEIFDDTLVVKFDDLYEYNEWTCLAEGSYMHVDTIIVRDLDSRLYRLFAEETRIYKESHLPDLYVAPYYQGDIDLRECVITSLPEKGNEMSEKLYPNPADQHISLNGLKGNIIFTNISGQRFTFYGEGQIDISKLEKGIYFVSYEHNGKMVREKVIVQ